MNAIEINNVSMQFNMSTDRIDSLKEYIVRLVKGKLFFEEFWALREISFSVGKGEVFGLVGLNGAGKSTLLKIVSGVMKPTTGSVIVSGSIAPLIELGAGFDENLTARENVFLNGAILGYSTDYMKTKYDEIINFSELWDFTDVPVKNFSSGMYARLGFSIATMVEPDVLIVDEILGVGDFRFQKKCRARIQNLVDKGTTILMVSHSSDMIRSLCSRVAWLEKGRLKMIGPTSEIMDIYEGSKESAF